MRALADLVYPQACVGCRRPARGAICRDCLDASPRLGPGVCRRCGSPSGASSACRECRDRSLCFDGAVQVFEFGGAIRDAILRLKYRGERGVAEALAAALVDPLEALPPSASLTWIPSDPERLKARGFDHGEVLVRALSEQTGRRAGALLVRTRPLKPQVRLPVAERRRNQDHSMRSRVPASDAVVLIDDVYTTGATASEAARALKASGAAEVVALGVARSLPPSRRPPL